MPWKSGYTISDEIALSDDQVVWPSGIRSAVSVTVVLSPATGPSGISRGDISGDEAELMFGAGLDALLDLLNRFAVRATFAVPGVIAAIESDKVRRLAEAGHEIAALGFRHEDPTGLSLEDERDRIKSSVQLIGDAAGVVPAGWYGLPRPGDRYASGTIGPNTVDLLIDEGFAYLGNGLADDVPHYWVTDPSKARAILTMPYSYHFDDQFFLLFPPPILGGGSGLEQPAALARNWSTAFSAQHDRGRMFTMTLHPNLIGCLHRIPLLESFLASLTAREDVWIAPAKQFEEHWRTQHPPETHLRLEPSIWRSYPDSLD
ncbi:MAG: polysaccharide deacetylase family protein [Spiribacter salinus]|uniref:Polysaccharide deacetylase family protein n=1 Tax=Spiribacter salinus TaxID=1335746 RepID=A0A540VNS2_9GAMM|nr:MAG: polysaccharide deacetylase family protein [Spiribacter salinus]